MRGVIIDAVAVQIIINMTVATDVFRTVARCCAEYSACNSTNDRAHRAGCCAADNCAGNRACARAGIFAKIAPAAGFDIHVIMVVADFVGRIARSVAKSRAGNCTDDSTNWACLLYTSDAADE